MSNNPANNDISTILQLGISSSQGQEAYRDVVLKRNNAFVTGFTKDDSMFVVAHGNEKGNIIATKEMGIGPKFLGSILQEENLIPENVKNIYTISCYGGLQQPFDLPNGVHIEPIHTSNEKIKFGLTQRNDGSISGTVIGVTDNSSLISDFKQKSNIQDGGKIDVDLAFTPQDFNNALINNKARHGALTPQEAFDKYGPDDDRFFTSQGLDPAEQRAKLEKTNKQKTKQEPEVKDVVAQEVADNQTKSDIKSKQSTSKPTAEPVVKTKATKKPELSSKKLSGNGKAAIGLAIVGLAVGGAIASNNKKSKKEDDSRQSNSAIDNSYAMQMAQDISTYKYGKHMTGFVNF